MKRFLSSFFVLVILIAVTSCGATGEAREFSSHGMNITLTDHFKEIDMDGMTVTFDSSDVAVFALKESFTLMDGFENYTLEQYGELVMNNNSSKNLSEMKSADGLMWFEYDFNNENNETYYYYTYIFKTDDAFWLIQFATLTENIEDYRDSFVTWAKSIHFD